MAKFVVLVQPSGCLNGRTWPVVGEVVDLPAAAAESMVEAGHLAPKVEKRPAPTAKVEKRG